MYCVRKITDDLLWIGASDRRLALFEGVYKIPKGVSYNSYLLLDRETVVFDTADHSVSRQYLENLAHGLGGRPLDYIIVQHMEMDHAATLAEVILRYPEVTIVCNEKTSEIMKQFFDFNIDSRLKIVNEGETMCTGGHTLTFVNAPMVHWPEVMMTYDMKDKILFSADAFGTFGALDGALFADEVDFFGDYLDEARRYYTNIVGKYGKQVQDVLAKASGLEIAYVCPLHGFVWRKRFGRLLDKYLLWSSYKPEEKGVVIAYASVYGNTANAAEILASQLVSQGVKVQVFDVSYTAADVVLAACFRYSHIVFASTTYNAGIYIAMEDLLHDIVNHNLQKRTVAFIENGSWAPASGSLMKAMVSKLPGMRFLDETVTIKSSVKEDQRKDLESLANALADSVLGRKPQNPAPAAPAGSPSAGSAAGQASFSNILRMSPADIMAQSEGGAPGASAAVTPAPASGDSPLIEGPALFNFTYGLYVLTSHDGVKDNGCIINSAIQITDTPKRMLISVNKANYSREVILNTGIFNLSIINEDIDPAVFSRFGHQTGRTADKFEGYKDMARSENGLYYITKGTNALLSGKVLATMDSATHTLFIAEVTEAKVLSDEPSAAYSYYRNVIKPKLMPEVDDLPPVEDGKKRYICNVCGYIYESDGDLPADYICPICKHGASDFSEM